MTASPSNDAAGADHSLLPLKALYALYFGGLGIYFTFINVYYRSIGLSGAQIGLLNTVAPLVGLFAGTVWGLLSDRFGRTRLLLMVATVGLIASTLLLATVQSFAALVLPVALFSLFNSAIVPLVDSVTLATLGEHRERYGAQRIWGSIGFIITSSLSGFLVDALGIRVIFIGFALALGLHVLVLRWLPERSIELRGSILRGLPALVRQPAWLLFMVSVTLIATAGYAMGAFLSLTVKTLGGSDALVGLAWTIAALSELPIMAGSAWLLSKVGPARLLTIAFLVYSVRMFLYSVVQVPESVLLINLVGGMSFGLYWV
ncbi:MAG: MFS transporter, partial [Anaerolineae bacterium]|nr:MFS transporter [Thermoflexales bacterium]MDW8407287.1 MFS transporter [Anaerolineae bacterium]